jgi:hypothetical protein
VIYSDQEEIWDRKGTPLRDDARAIEVARRVFNDFRTDRGPEDPNPTIIVKNEAGDIATPAIESRVMATPRRFTPPWTVEKSASCW